MGLLAAVGGFFLVPVGVGVTTRLITNIVAPQAPDTKLLPAFMLAKVASTYACYRAAEKAIQGSEKRSFLRGGMWGSGIDVVLTPVAVAVQGGPSTTTATSSSPSAVGTSQLAALHTRLLQGGFFKP